nr:acyl carrier protein [Rhodoferax sp.]
MQTASEIEGILTTIFRDVFMCDDIALAPDFTSADIDGWDSMKQIEILIATESYFGIKFNTREIDNLQSVGDLLSLISNTIKSKGSRNT